MYDVDAITDEVELNFDEHFVTRDVFDGKIKNIRGILEKLDKIFDVSKFEHELEQILIDVQGDSDKYNKMPFKDMQPIYEHGVYKKYSDRVDLLNKKLSSYNEFYDLYALYTSINNDISNVNCENIGIIIRDTKTLINILNSVNTFDDPKKIEIVNECYNTIYSVMIYERVFDRNDIFLNITSLNSSAYRENLGRILYNDITKYLTKEELIKLNVSTIDKDLDFDYITDDVISLISLKKVGEKNNEYGMRKESEINAFVEDYKSIINEKHYQTKRINQSRINNLKVYPLLSSFGLSAVPLVLIPIVMFNSGKKLGFSESQKITEYGIVTRTVNPNNGKIIDGPTVSYEEETTGYSATILVFSPWKKSPSGVGYISTVTAYEYIAPDNIDDDFHATSDVLNGDNIRVKYVYNKSKDVLDEDDSMTEASIQITETYYDNSLDRPSNKYTVLFTILGTLLGVTIDLSIVFIAAHNIDKIRLIIDKLKSDINNNKLTINDAKNEIKKLVDKSMELQNKKRELNSKYGVSDKELSLRLKK